jgi:hypothetical protein
VFQGALSRFGADVQNHRSVEMTRSAGMEMRRIKDPIRTSVGGGSSRGAVGAEADAPVVGVTITTFELDRGANQRAAGPQL